ncbi:MAG: GxxExxY protein [Saprospiraceae bacterium]
MRITKKYINDLSYKILGCAIEVHKYLGPGLLESVYEKCFLKEPELQGLKYRNQICTHLDYKGLKLDTDLRLDVLVEDIISVELKAQEGLVPIHDAIILSYMHMLDSPKGILINFRCINIMSSGQKTFVNRHFATLPDE